MAAERETRRLFERDSTDVEALKRLGVTLLREES